MKTPDNTSLLKPGLVISLLLAGSFAQADWSANLAYASEYHYRGIFQKSSSASGGVDYATGGFYAGTWAADVGDGLEVDGYFGYGADVAGVSLSAGYTGYFYTGDFDDTYREINLGAGYGLLSLDMAFGEYENFAGPTEDYTYYALTLEKEGFYGKYAGFSRDFEGNYLEFGYGTTVAGIALGVVLLFADSDLAGDNDQSLIFTLGRSFDL